MTNPHKELLEWVMTIQISRGGDKGVGGMSVKETNSFH